MAVINEFNSGVLRNAEDFQHKTDVYDLVIEIGADNLGISKLFNDVYVPALNNYDTANKKGIKSSLTELTEKYRAKRSDLYIGMVDIVKASLRGYSDEMVAAAKRVIIIIDNYNSINNMTLSGATGELNNLLREFPAESASLEDAKLIGIGGWLEELANVNKEFDKIMKMRDKEKVGKTDITIKEARKEIMNAYKLVCNMVEVLVATDGISKYKEFIRTLNVINARYSISSSKTNVPQEEEEEVVEEKYPGSREWTNMIEPDYFKLGDICFVVVDDEKKYYEMIDESLFNVKPHGEEGSLGWKPLD